ncbi:predicted protein [Postia placenta Mad-698-R]|uniref:SHSP domain-containing protein n=1 Tax=Postia placenta MAD-698-R-SB12 TaxID=670580 RepID=A0A1X6NBJ7_9APHY|nr:hypothetical protein POSPLADRAFT_1133180 [Postia placenta MAD-698-R-SB12]EED79260.1 predicted protein [Postia placenta Mad-698-R]OSX66015.1 hypothetical protein POSPLADRAFT_1133180 [Postia placenta MAD-698-R-SB12]
MPLQSPPSLSSQDDSSPSSSSQAFSSGLNTSPASSRPLLRTSTSDPAAGLTIPFEQLTLQEQKDFWSHHPQIAHVKAHAPRNPSVGIEPQQIEPGEYYNMEMFDNRMREHEGGKGKGKDAGTQLQHACASPLPSICGSDGAAVQLRQEKWRGRDHLVRCLPTSHVGPAMAEAGADGTEAGGVQIGRRWPEVQRREAPGGPVNVMPDGDGAHSVFGAYDFERSPGPAGGDHAGSAGSSASSSDSLPTASSQSSPPTGPTLSRVDTPMDTGSSAAASSSAVASTSTAHYHIDAGLMASTSQHQLAGTKVPASPVHPFSRPYSSPDTYGSRQPPARIHSPTPVRAAPMPDRSSTASLPLPFHTPFHTLPSVAPSNGAIMEDRDPVGRASLPQQQAPSLSYFAGPSRYRSSAAEHDSDWPDDRSVSPPMARILERAYPSMMYPLPHAVPSPELGPLPPPAPPVVLTPPPPPLSEETRDRAPHEPFLAHDPAPHDSYIAVETNPREYRLLVRLPGFRRDAITLSTRKRRILHVVADSWEPNGGHFERRISFGYDADLAQVRAEFDGEFLRVIVPRRGTPASLWGIRD